MKMHISVLLPALLLIFPALSRAAEPTELSPAQFDKLHKLIKPADSESPWAEIPWETCLWEGRKKAAAEGKPMFLWGATEGNPIGLV